MNFEEIQEKHKKETMKKKEEVIKILASYDIEMSIGGCGCCNSPWVTFIHKGEKIADDVTDFGFDMTTGQLE